MDLEALYVAVQGVKYAAEVHRRVAMEDTETRRAGQKLPGSLCGHDRSHAGLSSPLDSDDTTLGLVAHRRDENGDLASVRSEPESPHGPPSRAAEQWAS